MFKRSNLISKYKQYTKSLKAIKLKTPETATVAQRCINLSESVKKSVENSSAKSREVLGIVYDKIAAKVNKTESQENVTLVQKLQQNKFLRITPLAAAVPILKPTTPEQGYHSSDYDILKLLGVLPNAPTNSNMQEQTLESQVASENAASDLSANTSNDFPPSLFQNESYTSIFDNMPQDENNLYTTFSNAFSFSSDKSTQVSRHDLQEQGHLNESQLKDDYFVIETPGAANTNEASGDGAELTSTNEETTAPLEAEVIPDVANVNVIDTPLADPNIIVEAIPEPPSAPDLAAEAASQLNALGEATFASLGLGGWTPVGIVQNCFEYLHVTLGIPWWEAIALGTLVIRLAMFPLVIVAQKNAARMNNHLPQMQVIQMKMTEARQSGNQLEVARYSQELMTFMKDKNLNPFKNMIVPLAQMPIFISFFMGLRQMANVPVESLRTGGLFWFTDLTVPDQFFALPVITSLTLWATIELGTDSARLSSQNLQTMKYVLRALPLFVLPFTVNFPGAILCYWVSSNFISLAQVGFLKIPAVRDYFNIDPMLKHDPTKLPIKNKGFVGGIKDSWTNLKITKELEERRRLDEMQFQRAGKGPLVKTYKYDPTKQVKPLAPNASPVAAVKAKSAIKSSH